MTTSPAYTASEIISITNATRQSYDLDPLHPNDALNQAAAIKAQAMISAKSWSHNTPDQTTWQFIDASGYKYSVAGENLARNFESATAVVDAWLNSPSHRNNLLSPQYTQIGVSIIQTDDDDINSLLVVQYLATPISTTENQISPQYNPTQILESMSLNIPIKWITILLISVILIITLIKKKSFLSKLFKKNINPHPKHWRT